MNSLKKAILYFIIAILVRFVVPIFLTPIFMHIDDIDFVHNFLPIIHIILAIIRFVLTLWFFKMVSQHLNNIPFFRLYELIVCLVLVFSVVEYGMSFVINSYNLYLRLYNIIIMFYYFAGGFFFFYTFILFVSTNVNWINRLMVLFTSVGVLIITNFIGNSLLNSLMVFFNTQSHQTFVRTYTYIINLIVFIMFVVQAMQIYRIEKR